MAETGWVPSQYSRILGRVFPGGRIQTKKMDMLWRGARIQYRLKLYFEQPYGTLDPLLSLLLFVFF